MSPEDCKAVVRRYVEEIWSEGDPAALDTLTTPTYTYHLGGQPARDRAGLRRFLAIVRVAFPDWRVCSADLLVEGDTVAVRWQGRATYRGPFHGLPPTGKEVVVSGINLYRLADGKVDAEWEQMDSLGLLYQLGLLSPARADGAHGEAPG
jgi:steroid delta-isomerase-like uncharacterized protein